MNGIRDRLLKKKINAAPKRPTYSELFGRWPRSSKQDGLACRHCSGSGRVLHPDAQCDPVEGYKGAERINCPTCKGTGVTSYEAVDAEIRAQMIEAQERYEKWEKDAADLAETLSRLTDRQVELIRNT